MAKRTGGCVAQHVYYVVEKGIGENLSNDLEGLTVPGHSFLRKGCWQRDHQVLRPEAGRFLG